MDRTERRTRYGMARRRSDGWTWVCNFCAHTVALGMTPDVRLDPAPWLEAVDDAHKCEHKPTNGEPNT